MNKSILLHDLNGYDIRSPALKMPQTFIGFFSDEGRERFLAGEPVRMGYDRPMELTVSFYWEAQRPYFV